MADLKKFKQEVAKLSDADFDKFAAWIARLHEERDYRKLASDKSGIPYTEVLKKFKKFVDDPWKKDGSLCLEEAHHGGMIMGEFYEKNRVRGCPMDEDADILTAEWGPVSAKEFRLAYVRELAPPRHPDRDTEIWQLSLEMRFPMSPQLKALKSGQISFPDLRSFEGAFLNFRYKSKVGKMVGDLRPTRTLVTYENVE